MNCSYCGSVVQYSDYKGAFVCPKHGKLDMFERENQVRGISKS